MISLPPFDLYALFCVEGIGSRKLNRLLSSGDISFNGIEDLMAKDPDELSGAVEYLNRADIDALRALDLAKIRTEYDDLSRAEVDLVTVNSPSYPPLLRERLGLDAPPILFCLGNAEVVSSDMVAIVGSRNVSDQSLELTRELVMRLKSRNVAILSGGARGIDSAAHYAAVEYGLRTVVVVAHGINHVLRHGVIDEVKDRVLHISQFHPNSGWSPAFAMIRNKTVCSMSRAVFVVEAGECSGTINTGEAALRIGIPLYVVSPSEFETPPNGNRYLISKGGRETGLDFNPDIIQIR